MRELGSFDGSIFESSSQLICTSLSPSFTFLTHAHSGLAPRPWTATMLRKRPNGKFMLGLRWWYLRLTQRKAAGLHKALSTQALPEILPFLDASSKKSLTGCVCLLRRIDAKKVFAVTTWRQPWVDYSLTSSNQTQKMMDNWGKCVTRMLKEVLCCSFSRSRISSIYIYFYRDIDVDRGVVYQENR